MSAPHWPRRGRGRGRGSAATAERGSRGANAGKAVDCAAASSEATYDGTVTKQFKPPPPQNTFRGAVRQSSPSPARRGRGGSPPRNSRTSMSPPQPEAGRNIGGRKARGGIQKRMNDVFHQLKNNREQERTNAIKNGVLADPEKPTTLANAITPVGICQDMCPRFERAERIVQLMVDSCEKKSASPGVREPCERKMVKRFRRSAAGYDEQLPSDIRPPLVLQKTLNYLIDEVVGGPQPLATVHKFVWDRTRGIRNDFSIQQVTKLEDLRVAIACFERIARFHIVSLHQLSHPDRDNGEFDHHQEREQLNNTLLSLMYYYEDSRHRLKSPNEAEFRAYCIVFEIQDQRPDLEDRAQQWPRSLLRDQRVQTALKLYAAAENTSDEQGPLRPRASFAVAQADTGRFWQMVQSHAVPYTMACVAEIYFNLVRRITLEAVWKAYKGKRAGPTKMEDWILADLTVALGFDDEEQSKSYVQDHGFVVADNDSGHAYVDLGSVSSKYLTDSKAPRKQIFSETLVESKRLKRTLPALIKGVTASEAQSRGLIEVALESRESQAPHHDSLFISGDSDDEMDIPGKSLRSSPVKPRGSTPVTNGNSASTKLSSPTASFGAPKQKTATAFAPSPFEKSQHERAPVVPMFASSPCGVPNPFSSSKSASPSFGKSSTGKVPITAPSFFRKPSPFASLAAPPPTTENTNAQGSYTDQVSTYSSTPFEKSTSPPISRTSIKPSSALPNHQQSLFHAVQEFTATDSQTGKAAKPTSHLLGLPTVPPTPQQSPTSALNTPKYSFGTSLVFNNSASDPPHDAGRIAADPKDFTEASVTTSSKPDPTLRLTSPTSQSPSGFDFQPQLRKPITNAPFQFPTSQLPYPDNKKPRSPTNVSAPNHSPQFAKPAAAVKQVQSLFTPTPPQPYSQASTQFDITSSEANAQTSTQSQPKLPLSRPLQDLSHSPTTPADKVVAPPYTTSTAREESPAKISAKPFAKPEADQNSARSQALSALAKSLMLDDRGLLQQFVEYTIGSIVTASIRQVKEEKSWQEARKCRTFLLSKKYLRFWKTAAWRLGLLRKGRDRRKNLAQSMRDLSRSVRRQTNTDIMISTASTSHDTKAQRSMPPPAKPSAQRNSLPANLLLENRQPAATPSKRKLDEQCPEMEHKSPRRKKVHHRRSTTVASSDMSNNSSQTLPQPDLHHSARLSFTGKTDTTQTDYFRLKALGINPDTPRVPLTGRKRARDDESDRNEKRPKRSREEGTQEARSEHPSTAHPSPHSGVETTRRSDPSAEADEDADEALFARLRKVRDAMSDSITWFQSERAKSERASSSGAEAPLVETPAQTRLREFSTTPSRTEQRLRSTGAYGLLPKAWLSNPSWRDANRRITTDSNAGQRGKTPAAPSPPEAVGWSAFTGARWGVGKMGAEKPTRENGITPTAAGSSVDDAIEL